MNYSPEYKEAILRRNFTPNALAINLRSLKLSQSPFSILLIFDWLKPIRSPGCS